VHDVTIEGFEVAQTALQPVSPDIAITDSSNVTVDQTISLHALNVTGTSDNVLVTRSEAVAVTVGPGVSSTTLSDTIVRGHLMITGTTDTHIVNNTILRSACPAAAVSGTSTGTVAENKRTARVRNYPDRTRRVGGDRLDGRYHVGLQPV
jgi:hypothetical protein